MPLAVQGLFVARRLSIVQSVSRPIMGIDIVI